MTGNPAILQFFKSTDMWKKRFYLFILKFKMMTNWIAQSGLQFNLVDWIVIDKWQSKVKIGFNICCSMSFSKIVGLWLYLDWIVNPFWKLDCQSRICDWFGLDCQSRICDWFGLDWQSKKIGLSNSLNSTLIALNGPPNCV